MADGRLPLMNVCGVRPAALHESRRPTSGRPFPASDQGGRTRGSPRWIHAVLQTVHRSGFGHRPPPAGGNVALAAAPPRRRFGLHVGSEMPAAAGDALTIGQPLGSVGRQRGIDRRRWRRQVYRPAPERRLAALVVPMPTCGRATAAASPSSADAADNHRRSLQVDDRLQQRLAHLRHHFGERRRQQLMASARIRASTSGCSRSGGTAPE